MDISAVIFATHRIRLLPDEGKIPWDEYSAAKHLIPICISFDTDKK